VSRADKTLKAMQRCFRRAKPHKNIAEIPRQQENTQPKQTKQASKKLRLFFSTHQMA
jgi:hypothetical protein